MKVNNGSMGAKGATPARQKEGLKKRTRNKPRVSGPPPTWFPLNEKGWISRDDILQSLKKANLKADQAAPQSEKINEAVTIIDEAISAAINDWITPARRDRDRVCTKLKSIAGASDKTKLLILRLLPEWETVKTIGRDEQEILSMLAARVRNSSSPIISALKGAAATPTDVNSGAINLAKRLIDLEELSKWATDSSDQWRTGWVSQVEKSAIPDERKRAQLVGHSFILAWVILTDRVPAYSRPSPGPTAKKEPGGPLIRFLVHLFSCVRRRISRQAGIEVQADRGA